MSELRRYFDYFKNSNKKIKFIRIKLNYSTNPGISARGNSIVYPPLTASPTSLRVYLAVSLLCRPDILPTPHAPFTLSNARGSLPLDASTPVRIFSSRAMRAVIVSKFWLACSVSFQRRTVVAKRKKRRGGGNRKRFADCSRVSFAESHTLTRVESANQIDSSNSANPILEFSCAICDRLVL